jgi:hypothetical protein
LLTFERVEVSATSNNTITMILETMDNYGDFTNEDMASKWIFLECNGDVMF